MSETQPGARLPQWHRSNLSVHKLGGDRLLPHPPAHGAVSKVAKASWCNVSSTVPADTEGQQVPKPGASPSTCGPSSQQTKCCKSPRAKYVFMIFQFSAWISPADGGIPAPASPLPWLCGGWCGQKCLLSCSGEKKIVSGPPHSNPVFPENEPTQAQWAGRGLAGSAQVWLPAAG